MRILLVDDEVELTKPLSRVLQTEGYSVDIAQEGATGLAMAIAQSYDLLILDWMLPQLSGLDLCQTLRRQGKVTPVLFLTAKDTLDDRVEGLDAGADDYLVKPFELRELLARVRALLRRSPPHDLPTATTKLKYDELELDPANQVVTYQGQFIDLSEKETQLLAYFLQNPGQLLTHQQIQTHLWGNDHQLNSNVLAAQIRLLRRKIEKQPGLTLIHTVYGKGYRFGTTAE